MGCSESQARIIGTKIACQRCGATYDSKVFKHGCLDCGARLCMQCLAQHACPSLMKNIRFDAEAIDEGVQVSVLSLSGEAFQVNVKEKMTIRSFKQALAAQLQVDVYDFQLVADGDVTPLNDKTLVGTLVMGEVAGSAAEKVASIYMLKQVSLASFERKGRDEWLVLAKALQNHNVADDEVLVQLCAFLDAYPALVNLQLSPSARDDTWPLLAFAVKSAKSMQVRQQCVDELIKRGARINIRHEKGYLINCARASASAYVEYLEAKSTEYRAYEIRAISEWRNVSSKLCGESFEGFPDEIEMNSIVSNFCKNHPEMVNFQNNHAVGEFDNPYGYFGYAPLISFAGAQACRHRRGGGKETADTRKGAVEILLRHGARVDMHHAKLSSLEWMKKEGSPLTSWLQAQLKEPAPAQEPFEFAQERRPR